MGEGAGGELMLPDEPPGGVGGLGLENCGHSMDATSQTTWGAVMALLMLYAQHRNIT